MGNEDSKPTDAPLPPPKDLNEIILEMRMQSKTFERQSKHAEKEKEK